MAGTARLCPAGGVNYAAGPVMPGRSGCDRNPAVSRSAAEAVKAEV